VLDEATLEALAGQGSFARGEECAANGAVGRLELAGDVVLATVHGSHPYRVRLGVSGSSGRSLTFSCTCPIGVEGAFCKHCVAVGLCWLSEGRPARSSAEVVREHLLGLSARQLVDILLDHARGIRGSLSGSTRWCCAPPRAPSTWVPIGRCSIARWSLCTKTVTRPQWSN
jgi:uncharacterized Zn finger protein